MIQHLVQPPALVGVARSRGLDTGVQRGIDGRFAHALGVHDQSPMTEDSPAIS
jgi:hypothetical protein